MKLKQKNFFTKKKIIITVLALALVGGGVYAYSKTHSSPSSSSDSTSKTQTDKSQNKEVNKAPATSDQVQAGNDAKLNTVTQNDAQSTPTPASFTATITAASQYNGTVSIRTLISGVVSQSGTCNLTITNGSQKITNSAATQALADSTTCQGFNVPVSQLGSGTWNITITATINGQSASASKTLAVQ